VIFPIFLVCLSFSVGFILLSQRELLGGLVGVFEQVTLPVQRLTYSIGRGRSSDTLSKLREENASLLVQFAKQKDLEKENKALHDQFATVSLSTKTLLPAQVVGSPAFLPGFSGVDSFIVSAGRDEGVAKGDVVVYKDNLVGKVSQVAPHQSIVLLPTNKESFLAVKTAKTSALGVLAGQGGEEMILDKVVLSDTLGKGDLVVTKGDLDTKGGGYPPDLIVGRIVSVHKKSSDLFQTADVISLLPWSRLETVFVMVKK
jgi:rod shape-determining protein MreC